MQNERGFTIVELLIVVVVIAILAAITLVSYNGIRDRSIAAAVQSDISSAAKSMELAKVESGTDTYPTSFPSSVKASNNIGLSLSEAGSGYCVNGQTLSGSIQRFSISASGMQSGTCPGPVISQSEIGMPSNLVRDTGFASITPSVANNWFVSRGGGTGTIAPTSRAGTNGDPFANRSVLQITNNANPAINWTYLSGPVNAPGIKSGKSYTMRYWVRVASGSYPSAPNLLGVQNASATDLALASGTGTGSTTGTWREVTRTSTATKDGTSAHLLYLALSPVASQSNTFTLEFQGFEVYEN